MGVSKKDKLAWFVLGIVLLIGATISFFCPKLIFAPFASVVLTKSFTIFARLFFAVIGIFMILQGFKTKE